MKRVLSLVVSAAILVSIYLKIDFAAMLGVLQHSRLGWLAMGLALLVPTTALTAQRLRWLVPARASLSFGDALGLTLSASVLNMVLPSKMGDVAKGYFMRERGGLGGGAALAIVVFEKGWDVVALLGWCLLGLTLLPRNTLLFWVLTAVVAVGLGVGLLVLCSVPFARWALGVAGRVLPRRMKARVGAFENGWGEVQRLARGRQGVTRIGFLSLFIWFVHLVQIWIFMLALRAHVPFLASLGRTPLAIFAGLLPLTFAGIGTRDAALIYFYRGYFSAAVGAALGLLSTLRYVLPALAGLPFFHRYLAYGRRVASEPTATAHAVGVPPDSAKAGEKLR